MRRTSSRVKRGSTACRVRVGVVSAWGCPPSRHTVTDSVYVTAAPGATPGTRHSR